VAWAAAAVWAFAFAAVSFYWAAGGQFGVATIAADIDAIPLAGDPRFVTATGVAKIAAGCLPLALHRAVGTPRRRLRVVVWIVGGAFALYGLANFVDHAAMTTGLRAAPEALGATAARWHLLFWDPFWMLGGALFLATARADAGR
jgi:hypothetical protein